MRFGKRFCRTCRARPRIAASRRRTTVCFCKRFCGGFVPGRRGATCHWLLATGTASSNASASGQKRVYSSACSSFYCSNLTSNTPSSTAPSSAFTRRRAAQKGDSQSGHWALKRRIDDQSSYPHRCSGKPRPFQIASRSAQRDCWRTRFD